IILPISLVVISIDKMTIMTGERIRELFQKLINDHSTNEELEALFDLLKDPEHEQTFRLLMAEHWDAHDFALQKVSDEKRRRMLGELTRLIGENNTSTEIDETGEG